MLRCGQLVATGPTTVRQVRWRRRLGFDGQRREVLQVQDVILVFQLNVTAWRWTTRAPPSSAQTRVQGSCWAGLELSRALGLALSRAQESSGTVTAGGGSAAGRWAVTAGSGGDVASVESAAG